MSGSVGVTRRQFEMMDKVREPDSDEEFERVVREAAGLCCDKQYMGRRLSEYQQLFTTIYTRCPENRAILFSSAVLAMLEYSRNM